jgi:invasion protein IalB
MSRILGAAVGLAIALACHGASAQTAAKPAAAKPAAAPAAAAPISADPQTTTANYGDWTVRCQRVGDGAAAKRFCEVAQTIQQQGGQGPIAEIALGRLAPADPLRLTIVLPPNVGFPSSPRMGVDENDAHSAELAWRRCLPGGCFADSEMKDDLLQRWRGLADHGQIRFKDSAGHDVAVPFSFKGLAQALDALAKT